MRLPIEFWVLIFVLVAIVFLLAPSTVLAVAFLAVLWAVWRRSPRRRGGRR